MSALVNQEARPDNPQTHSGGSSLLWWVVGAAAIYVVPFVMVMIDERILKTFWFSHHSPEWMSDFMRAIYPFWKVFAG